MAWEQPAGQGRRVKLVPVTELDASQWSSAHSRACAAAIGTDDAVTRPRMDNLNWKRVRDTVSAYRSQLRFSLRMTAAGLLALIVAQSLALPLHGLWVVLTAVVVTQMSVGGSLRATIEYTIGTLGGAIYAAAIGVLVPHAGVIAQGGVLALTIAPLAFVAAINPNFRVAPFSAVLVLLLSGQLGEGPIESAFTRFLEVAFGGAIAIIVSLLVFSQRVHHLGAETAAQILQRMAKDFPELLAGFTRRLDAKKCDSCKMTWAGRSSLFRRSRRRRNVSALSHSGLSPIQGRYREPCCGSGMIL